MTIPGWPYPSRLRTLPDSARGLPADLTGERGVRAAILAVRAGRDCLRDMTAAALREAGGPGLAAVNKWREAYYQHPGDPLPLWGRDWQHEVDKRNLLDCGRDLIGALAASSVLPMHMYECVAAGTRNRERPDTRDDVCRTAWEVARLIQAKAGAYMVDLFMILDARYAGGWQRWGEAGRPCGACGASDRDRLRHQTGCNVPGLVKEYVEALHLAALDRRAS